MPIRRTLHHSHIQRQTNGRTSQTQSCSDDVFQGAKNFIRTDIGEDGKHHPAVNDDVLSELKNVKEKLVVVSIAGPYRSGKSYLLTKLAKKAGSTVKFKVGHTVEPETKGLWIMVIDHPRRRDVKIALVDTEGIGDTQKGDSQHDAILFVLTSLLSNIMIYNGKNAIDEKALETFSAEMSKYVASKSKTSSQNDEALMKIFPDLVYVVRDFTLQRRMTADQYLEHALRVSANADPTAPRTKVRTCIKKYFQRRRCFTLDIPAAGRRTITQMDTVDEEKLNPDFLEVMEILCRFILDECEVKASQSRILNGQQFATMVETYVNAYRSGEIPNVSTAMDDLKTQENQKAMDCGERVYLAALKRIKDSMPMRDIEVLHGQRESYKHALVSALEMAILDDPDEKRRFKEKLQAKVDENKQELLNENNQMKSRRCNETLKSLYKLKISDRLRNYMCIGGYEKYQFDLLTMELKYNEQIDRLLCDDSEMKDTILSEFQRHTIIPDLEVIRETEIKLFEAEERAREQKRTKEKYRREREEMKRQRKKAEERKRQLEEEERRDRFQREELMRQQEAARREREEQEEQMEEMRREMEEAAAERRWQMERYEEMQREEMKRQRKKAEERKRQLEEEERRDRLEREELMRQQEATRREREEQEEQMEEMRREMEEAAAERRRQMERYEEMRRRDEQDSCPLL